MQPFQGAVWLEADDGTRMLLLAAERGSGGCWRYTYSVSPGVTMTLVTVPSAGAPAAGDTVCANIVAGLMRRLQ